MNASQVSVKLQNFNFSDRDLAPERFLDIRQLASSLNSRPARKDGQALLRGVKRLLNSGNDAGNEVSDEFILWTRNSQYPARKQ